MRLADSTAAHKLGDWLTDNGLVPSAIRAACPPVLRMVRLPQDRIDLAILNSEQRTTGFSAS